MGKTLQKDHEHSTDSKPKLKIGILGSRGIPNTYGGFEQFAQFLAEGLTQKGHNVYVYNSHLHHYKSSKWKEANIIHCKDYEDKIGTAGQFIYDLNCLLDARKRNYDILLQLGYTSNSIWHKLWPKNSVNIINMDGLEWKRTKYNATTKKFLKKAESWAARNADLLISDSLGIKKYLKEEYNKESIYIPYGAHIFDRPEMAMLKEFNLQIHNYHLIIARLEPENNIEMIIQGYLLSEDIRPLMIVGNTNNKFGNYLTSAYKHKKIIFTEGIYDQEKLNNLRYFSDIYFHGHSVGGTNPSLLEAMACNCVIAVHDNLFNKAIISDYGYYFSTSEDIKNILIKRPLASNESNFKMNNLERIKTSFNWEKVVNDYEQTFYKVYKKALY